MSDKSQKVVVTMKEKLCAIKGGILENQQQKIDLKVSVGKITEAGWEKSIQKFKKMVH